MILKVKDENGHFKEVILKGTRGEKGERGERGERGEDGTVLQQKEIDNIKTSLGNNVTELTKIKDRVVNENLTKYRFIATSFNQTDMKLVTMFSNDGSIWYVPNPSGDFTSTTGNGTLRDPSMLQWGDWYYICYTKIAWGTGNTIGYCRTKNFIDYEEFNDIAIGNYNKLWAPEFFRDYKTHKTYLVYSGSTNIQTDEFRGYLQEISFASSGEMIKINEPIKLTGSCDINAIDFSIYQDTYKYYLVYKNEDNKTMNIAKSENISGDYEIIKENFMTNTEGYQIIKIQGGYRIYFDYFLEDKLAYVDTYDSFVSFTGPVELGYPNGYHGRHMFVLDTNQLPHHEVNLKPYSIFKNSTTKWIGTDEDIIVPIPEVIINNDFKFTDTEIIIPSDGAYLLTLSLSWVENSSGQRTIALEQNGNAVAISTVNACKVGQTAQNISVVIYAKCDDKVRISVRQSSGVALQLVNWSHSVVLTCNKL